MFSVPHWADPNAVFYNKTLLRQAGARDPWDDLKGEWSLTNLVELAKAVTRDLDGDGRPDTWGLQWNYNHPSHVAMLAWTLGRRRGRLRGAALHPGRPVSVEAHRQLQQWLSRDRILLPLAEVGTPSGARPAWSRSRPAGWPSRCGASPTWRATRGPSATPSTGT